MGESSPVKVQVFLHKDDTDAALSQAQQDSPPIVEVASQPKSREDIQAPASWQQDYAPLRLGSNCYNRGLQVPGNIHHHDALIAPQQEKQLEELYALIMKRVL